MPIENLVGTCADAQHYSLCSTKFCTLSESDTHILVKFDLSFVFWQKLL